MVNQGFSYMAEKHQHQWLSELNYKKIDLGRGKRVIGVGGEYDSKYQLSVPKLMEYGE